MATPYTEAYDRYEGNDSATEFEVSFPYQNQKEVVVYLKRSDEVQVILTTADYTFLNETTIIFPKNGSTQTVLATGDVLVFQRESVFKSDYVFENQKRLYPEEVMNADDNEMKLIQELKRDLESTVKVDPTSSIQPDEYLSVIDESVRVCNEQAGIATQQATIATNQATIATQNATQTGNDRQAVATYRAEVETIATEVEEDRQLAQTAAGTAAQDASDASSSATSAETNAGLALGYKNDSATNAQTASTKAGEASNSAISAGESEDNSQIWAEGTDTEVQALGGVHSSKGWADTASQTAQSDWNQTDNTAPDYIKNTQAVKDTLNDIAMIPEANSIPRADSTGKLNSGYIPIATDTEFEEGTSAYLVPNVAQIKSLGSGKMTGEIFKSIVPLDDINLLTPDGRLLQGDGSWASFVTYMMNKYISGDITLYAWVDLASSETPFIYTHEVPTATGSVDVYDVTDDMLGMADFVVTSSSQITYDGTDYTRLESGDTILNNPPDYFCTETEWQASITAVGTCGKFVYDTTDNTLRIPKTIQDNRKLIKSYENGTGWYKIFEEMQTDGTVKYWCEQGGEIAYTTSEAVAVTFMVPYQAKPSLDITVGSPLVSVISAINVGLNTLFSGTGLTSTGFTTNVLSGVIDKQWTAEGYCSAPDGYQGQTIYEYLVAGTLTVTQIESDINNIAGDLALKADKDLTNTTPSDSFKETVVGWGMPDYSAGVSITVPASTNLFTAPSAGEYVFSFRPSGDTISYAVVNNVTTAIAMVASVGYYNNRGASVVVLEEGDELYFTGVSVTTYSSTFYPYKGINND